MIDRVFENIWSRKMSFFGVFMIVVTLTYGFLVYIDFVPETPSSSATSTDATTTDTSTVTEGNAATPQLGQDPTPDKIIFDSLGGKEVNVLNPTSSSIDVLNNDLLSGVVRHPDSADLLSNGTIFLFGHSSYLPVVHNKNFQAFNGIQDLKWGDKIRLRSSDYEYVYRVDREYEAKASTAEVELIQGTPRLTLSTCDTFGSKEDRFIVEATLVDSYPL